MLLGLLIVTIAAIDFLQWRIMGQIFLIDIDMAGDTAICAVHRFLEIFVFDKQRNGFAIFFGRQSRIRMAIQADLVISMNRF